MLASAAAGGAIAHDVSRQDAELILGTPGSQILIYMWLGAKHMVTGYDHLLFLAGVVFYVRSLKSVAILASLFALGHSLTLISGVLLSIQINPYLVDAAIGLSVVYKGLDNLGGFETFFGEAPDERVAVLVFGLFHGLGLATKLQDLGIDQNGDGLLTNLVAFNVGVELGQIAGLIVILIALRMIPAGAKGSAGGMAVNVGLMIAGFALASYQMSKFVSS